MTVFLVRHARTESTTQSSKNGKRKRGRDKAPTVKLSAAGQAQARALVESLDGERIDRLIASPADSCLQSLGPLAKRRGIEIETDPRLLETASDGDLHDVLREAADGHVLCCSHGDWIERALGVLGVPSPNIRAGKASIWRISLAPGQQIASYDPPAVVGSSAATRLAVLDLGSTSFHLLVADVYDDGRIERVKRKREMLRLGAVLAESSELATSTVEAVCSAASALRDVAWSAGARMLHCVATAAFRDGAQGRRLASQLGARLRTPIRIFSGEEEAHAIFAAFRRRLDLGPEPVLGLDLGGGSLELAVGNASHVHWETTLPLGVVRLHRQFRRDALDADISAVREHVKATLSPLRDHVRELGPLRCIATGGTARALGRLDLARQPDESMPLCGHAISRKRLSRQRADLAAATHDERLALPGMNIDRADLLPTGAAIFETVLSELDQSALEICDWGLREGVLLTVMRDARHQRREVYPLGKASHES